MMASGSTNSEKNSKRKSKLNAKTNPDSNNLSSGGEEKEEEELLSSYVSAISNRRKNTFASPFVSPSFELELRSDDEDSPNEELETAVLNETYFKPSIPASPEKKIGKVAVHHELRSPPVVKKSSPKHKPVINQEDIQRSLDIGLQANDSARDEKYSEAIELFTQAIALNSTDHRLFNNRSYCYDCTGLFEAALGDAIKAIHLEKQWPKGYYRKGRALAGLGRYSEAEEAFKKVLELDDGNGDEAKSEIIQVRQKAVMQLGYDEEVAIYAAKKYGSVREAIYSLIEQSCDEPSIVENLPKHLTSTADNKCILVDGETNKTFSLFNAGPASPSSDGLDDVTNPFGWKALWIGNLTSSCKEELLKTMFGKFGKLVHCGIYTKEGGTFALIHYDNPESPRKAMSEYQGAVFRGVSFNNKEPLLIRFRPNKDQKREKYQDKLDFLECYYWRTTGCFRGDECNFSHVKANKGVDIQPWMLHNDGKTPRSKDNKHTK